MTGSTNAKTSGRQGFNSSSMEAESRLVTWAPPLAMATVIFVMSTSLGGPWNSGRILIPLIRWLYPDASPAATQMVHLLVRKLAHLVEYALLFGTLIRGPLKRRYGVAFVICAIWAMSDEAHQIFVPGRGPSLFDVCLDCGGALFGRVLG